MENEFKKLFLSVCNWNNPWERWNDMLQLFAIDIANVTDTFHRAERNKHYAAIARKYKPNEFERFAELFNLLVSEFEKQPFQDYLGDMYMHMEFGSDAHGQFFTPYHLCQMMAHTAIPEETAAQQIEEHGWFSVTDCACGAGATLIAAAERIHELGHNYQQCALFIGQDIDYTVAMMCYIQLSLLGCAGHVHVGNTLTEPDVGDLILGDGKPNTWYMPMLFSDQWVNRAACRHMDLFFGIPKPTAKIEINPPAKPEKTQRKEEKPNGKPVQLSIF